MRKRFVGVFLLHLFVFLLPLAAQQDIVIVPNGPTITSGGDIIALYETTVGHWIQVLESYAGELFWALAALDVAWMGAELVLKHRMNLTVGVLVSVNKLVTLSFFLVLLLNGPQWIPLIVNTFPQMGREAAGISSIVPSAILRLGVVLSGKMLWAAGKSALLIDPVAGIAYVVAAAGVLIGFVILVLQFLVAKIECILAIGYGYIFLAFGGSRWTAPYVERYWSFAVASGLKLMALYLLIGAGLSAVQNWENQVQNLSISSFGVDVAWSVLAGTLLFIGVCWMVSRKVSSVLGGSPSLSASDGTSFLAAGITATTMGKAAIVSAAAQGLSAVGGSTVASSAPSGTTGMAASSGNAAPPPQPTAPGSNGTSRPAPPQPSAPGWSGATRVLQSLPHTGGSGTAPRMNGFGHE